MFFFLKVCYIDCHYIMQSTTKTSFKNAHYEHPRFNSSANLFDSSLLVVLLVCICEQDSQRYKHFLLQNMLRLKIVNIEATHSKF